MLGRLPAHAHRLRIFIETLLNGLEVVISAWVLEQGLRRRHPSHALAEDTY
jgi:hypothetical protein